MKASLLFLFAFILLLIPSYAIQEYKIEDLYMHIDIDDNGYAREEIRVKITSTKGELEELEYTLPQDSKNIVVTSQGKKLRYRVTGNEVAIYLENPIKENMTEEINIKFDIDKLAVDYKGKKVIALTYRPRAYLEHMLVDMKLPKDAVLTVDIDRYGGYVTSVFPEPKSFKTEEKEIIWEFNSIKSGEAINIFVMYELFSGRGNLLLIAIATFAFLLGFFLSRFLRREKSIIKKVLSEDEFRVYTIIKENGGKMKQDEITKITGFSKAKTSKIVRSLEEKDIIKKTPKGKTNIVELN